MSLPLHGKVALVTGAGKKIGGPAMLKSEDRIGPASVRRTR